MFPSNIASNIWERKERGTTPFLVTWTFPLSRSKRLAANLRNNSSTRTVFEDVYFHLNLRISGTVVTISTLSLSRARVTLCEALVGKNSGSRGRVCAAVLPLISYRIFLFLFTMSPRLGMAVISKVPHLFSCCIILPLISKVNDRLDTSPSLQEKTKKKFCAIYLFLVNDHYEDEVLTSPCPQSKQYCEFLHARRWLPVLPSLCVSIHHSTLFLSCGFVLHEDGVRFFVNPKVS